MRSQYFEFRPLQRIAERALDLPVPSRCHAWPLIQRVLADDVYAARYREKLASALGGLAAPDALAKRTHELHSLIASSLVGNQGERATHTTISSREAFESSIDGPNGLLEQMRKRQTDVRTALGQASSR